MCTCTTLSQGFFKHDRPMPHSVVHAACSSTPRGGASGLAFWQWTLSVTGAEFMKPSGLKRVHVMLLWLSVMSCKAGK